MHQMLCGSQSVPSDSYETSYTPSAPSNCAGCHRLSSGSPKVEAIGDKALKWVRFHLCKHIK